MKTHTRTSRTSLCVVFVVVIIVSTGCGGFTVLLGGGSPYGGYYYDDSHYYYDDYSYYDGYWYDYDDHYFVDYVDAWYDGGYYGCYNCKSVDDLDAGSLEEPAGWDAEWGPWERFVRARVDFLLAKRAQGSSEPQVPSGE